jgi:hypothetical protein
VSCAAAAAIACLCAALLAPALSTAAASPLVVDTLTPKLEPPASGDGSKFKLSFTNITEGPAILSVEPVGGPACKPTASENQLPPNQITAVEVELPKACMSTDPLKLKVTADLSGGVSKVFEIAPEGSVSKPDWGQLWAFAIALLVSLIAGVAFAFWGWKPQGSTRRERTSGLLGRPLRSIDVTTWKFNDNWGTNATAVGALLTGLFGSTTAKAFLGPEAEGLTALTTVGAAIALVLVTAAPVITVATKSYEISDKGAREAHFTVNGVLLAAVVVFAAAVGQLWIVVYTATELDLSTAATAAILATAVLALVLLVAYSWRSLKDLFEAGTEEPESEPEPAIEAATVVAKAIEAAAGEGGVRKAGIPSPGEAVEEPRPAALRAYRRRPRSALL